MTGTEYSKAQLATILSALDGQPRHPAAKEKALAAIARSAATLGLSTEDVLAAAPGLLDGRLDPAAWRAELSDGEDPSVAMPEPVEPAGDDATEAADPAMADGDTTQPGTADQDGPATQDMDKAATAAIDAAPAAEPMTPHQRRSP